MLSKYSKLVYFVVLMIIKLTQPLEDWLFDFSEHNKALVGFMIKSIQVDKLRSCIMMCTANDMCASINFDLTSLTCELSRTTKRAYPENIIERQNTLYMEILQDQTDWVRIEGSQCGPYDTFNQTGPVNGYIWSPGYPSQSGHDVSCSWTLASNTDITITFKAFSTESSYDKVQIFQGKSSSSSPIGTFSGTNMPQPTTLAKALFIKYTTDGSIFSGGFLASIQGIS